MEKHLFLGSNTPNGFFGRFDDLLDISKTIILKGGAGTGKSTLMKKIGDSSQSIGLDVEYYHCSSDVSSLDGIYIPSLNWSILDGTSPHTLEASMPAINQFIFNLAECADTVKLKSSSKIISDYLKCKKEHFNNAFCYLKSAFYVSEKINAVVLSNANRTYLSTLADDIFKLLSVYESNLSRQLFAQAITPQGIVSYAESCFSHTNNVYLKTNYAILAQYVIENVRQKLLINNIKHIAYLSPFNPKTAIALQIGNYAVTSDFNALQNYLVYNLDSSIINSVEQLFKDDSILFDTLFSNAVKELDNALKVHLEIEKYYIDALDFNDINNKTQQIYNLIFNDIN